MKLLVIRHAQAGNPEAWEAEGRDDRLRPITPDGKKEMREVAAGLARLVSKIDLLATSPLVRAVQTAEVVAAEYQAQIVTVGLLAPERDPGETVQWLREQRSRQTIALVGHEPHLSTLVSYLLAGKRMSFVDLKKGGACLLELADAFDPGQGTLEWLLAPRELRRLRK